MHFTGAFATVVIRRIGLPDSAKPYGYMRLFLRPTVPRVCATAVCPPSLRVHYDAFTGAPPPVVPPHYSLLTTYMSAVSNGLLPFTSADDPFVCFTGAFATVLIFALAYRTALNPTATCDFSSVQPFLEPLN